MYYPTVNCRRNYEIFAKIQFEQGDSKDGIS